MDRSWEKIRFRSTIEEASVEEEEVEREFLERERASMERASGSMVTEMSPRSTVRGLEHTLSRLDKEAEAGRESEDSEGESVIRQEQMLLQNRLLLGRKNTEALRVLREERRKERQDMEVERESIEMQRRMERPEREEERESWQRQKWRREREDMQEQRRGERVEWEEERRRASDEREELLEEGRRERDYLSEQPRQERSRLEEEEQESSGHEMWTERQEWRRERDFTQITLERVEILRRIDRDKFEGEVRVLIEVTTFGPISERESTEEEEEQAELIMRERVLMEEESSGRETEREESHLTVESENSGREIEREESHLTVETESSGREIEREESHLSVETESSGTEIEREESHLTVEAESSGREIEREESHLTVETESSDDKIEPVEELENIKQKNKSKGGFWSRRPCKKRVAVEGGSTEKSGEQIPLTARKVGTAVSAVLIQDSREEMEKETERAVMNEESITTGEGESSGTETTEKDEEKEKNMSKKRFWPWCHRRKQAATDKESTGEETGQHSGLTMGRRTGEACATLDELNRRDEMEMEESAAEEESSESETGEEEKKEQPTVEKETLKGGSGPTEREGDTVASPLSKEENTEEKREMEKEENTFTFQEKSKEAEIKVEMQEKERNKKTKKGFPSLFCWKKRSTVEKKRLKEVRVQQSVLTEKETKPFTEEGESSGTVMKKEKDMKKENKTRKTKRFWSLLCWKKQGE